jgi:hypothetical protein
VVLVVRAVRGQMVEGKQMAELAGTLGKAKDLFAERRSLLVEHCLRAADDDQVGRWARP